METAIKTKMTFHARVERLDRLVACIEHLGIGEIALEAVHNGVRFRLTTTGLCLIYAINEETLITGYMCPTNKCIAMYNACGYKRVPVGIFKTVTRNNKKYAFLLNMQSCVIGAILLFRRITSN